MMPPLLAPIWVHTTPRPGPHAGGDGARLREAAEGFEALFLEGLLKGLRRTTLARSGRDKTLYQGLLDEELVRLCATRGVGLAGLLEATLGMGGGSDPPGAKGSLKVSGKGPITPSGFEDGLRKGVRGRASEGLEPRGTCLHAGGGLDAREGTGASTVGPQALHPYGIRPETLRGVAQRGVKR